jgi:hypothetical protein
VYRMTLSIDTLANKDAGLILSHISTHEWLVPARHLSGQIWLRYLPLMFLSTDWAWKVLYWRQ